MVESASLKNCYTTHPQNRPPSPPIRKASYDTWSNVDRSKSIHDVDKVSRTCDTTTDEEEDTIPMDITKKEDIFNKKVPIIQKNVPSKFLDRSYPSKERPHSSSAGAHGAGARRTMATRSSTRIHQKKNARGGDRRPPQENVGLAPAGPIGGECRKKLHEGSK